LLLQDENATTDSIMEVLDDKVKAVIHNAQQFRRKVQAVDVLHHLTADMTAEAAAAHGVTVLRSDGPAFAVPVGHVAMPKLEALPTPKGND